MASVAIIVGLLLVVFVLPPVLVAVVDLLVVLLLALLGVASRVLLRRPWAIEATTPDE